MMFKKCFLILFCYFVFISALPSSKETTKQNDELESSNSVTASPHSTTKSVTHPPVANSPIIPQVVYHNQPMNTIIPRVKRSVIKFDHRKHHKNIYSIASGERGIRYIK
uniref:Uncharacterized protein n=1 Tax=Panagrolaimus sp. PS1159 TaxID=55785 RepID=A0AC35G132_9BILA